METEEKNIPGGETGDEGSEKTFTQSQLNAIVAREKAKAIKGMFSADDMAAKDTSISALTGERDAARADLKKAQDELTTIKQERLLLSKGVPQEDVEYYAFKIGKLVTDKKTFEQAADDFFKETKPGARLMSTGGSVGGGGAPREKTTNDIMNALIRGKK